MTSIFDNVQLENCFVLEGEQADAYKKSKEKKDDKKDYWRYHGAEKDSDGKGASYGNRYQNEDNFKNRGMNKSHDKFTVNHDPKYGTKVNVSDTATRYDKRDDVSNKEYKSALKDKKNERKYADKVTKDVDKKYGHDSVEAQSAKDAARRHYRKTMKEALDMLASIEYPYNG